MKPSYKGLLHKPVAPPRVNVLDVFECEFKPLLPPKGPGRPTILLFWSRWCLASQKMMEYMFKFSQFNNHKVELCHDNTSGSSGFAVLFSVEKPAIEIYVKESQNYYYLSKCFHNLILCSFVCSMTSSR